MLDVSVAAQPLLRDVKFIRGKAKMHKTQHRDLAMLEMIVIKGEATYHST